MQTNYHQILFIMRLPKLCMQVFWQISSWCAHKKCAHSLATTPEMNRCALQSCAQLSKTGPEIKVGPVALPCLNTSSGQPDWSTLWHGGGSALCAFRYIRRPLWPLAVSDPFFDSLLPFILQSFQSLINHPQSLKGEVYLSLYPSPGSPNVLTLAPWRHLKIDQQIYPQF